MFHESTQKDEALFDRLVTKKDLSKGFNAVQIKRLEKLGIAQRDPLQFSLEEKRRFARLDIDPDGITWNRVVDVNDRLLRKITVGQVYALLLASL